MSQGDARAEKMNLSERASCEIFFRQARDVNFFRAVRVVNFFKEARVVRQDPRKQKSENKSGRIFEKTRTFLNVWKPSYRI